MNKHHELKIFDVFFEEILSKTKKFEIRKNDRNYEVGDTFTLNEVSQETEEYTGRKIGPLEIKYILKSRMYLKDGDVCFNW